MNRLAKRLIRGHSIPRNVRKRIGSSSTSWDGEVVWKYRREEKVARHKEDSPTSERGRERERVG
jgi:hypothetical protein